ncbi:AIPR family protein [Mesorhizobium sp. ESP7-2]|uniref:AIPR family protein n=1 Tax=Mesorhizobium sp. ESP7-2 TaxID=2876622 RepID=UPI001CCA1AD5|nr:AIPR family protein [Mesorhizobium sp. ESP7-2]MBZ9711236.1 AIPR family protein [Mesorhizobium sp. ESP7-2]
MANNPTDWEQVLATLKADLNLPDDAIGLLALQLKFRLEDMQSVAAESITGGGDDKKCDILYVDKELQIGVIAQCYYSKTKKASAPANKASDLNTAIGWILNRDLNHLPDSLKGRADEFRSAIISGEIKQIYIWYVHNLPSSKNVANELKTVEHTAGLALKSYANGNEINIFAEEIGTEQISRLYVQAERTVIVTDGLETRVPDAIEIKSKEWSSVVTTVNAKWLSQLYGEYGTDLFSANLRGYLGSRASDSNINNGIKTTALNEPENFWVFNNGITALVVDYDLGPRTNKGRKLKIKGISIVNGAQTTGSLSSLGVPPSDSVLVPIRFVKSNKESIVSKVVRFNNSQNKLQAADFRSTDQIQERLRKEFSKIPDAEYEGGRRGGTSDAIRRSKYTLPSYTVGQSLAAFHGDPVTAYDKKSEIWTSENIYRRFFTDRTTARHIVFCFSLLEEINTRRLALTQKQRKDDASLTQSEKAYLNFLSKKGAAYLLVYVIAMCMETVVGKSISNKSNLQFKNNVSPEKASKIWTPIVDLMLSLSNQLDSAFSRNRISNETVQKSVPNFVGVIESLKKIHQPTFSEFSKQVEVTG